MVTKPIANNSKIVIDCPILILIYWFSVSAFWPRQAEHSLRYGGSVFEDTPVVATLKGMVQYVDSPHLSECKP
jgi:hypothetical protein